MKRTNSITRVLCAVLAVVTVLAFASAFPIVTFAADSAGSFYVNYNFNSGTVGKALVKDDLTNSAAGVTGLSVSSERFLYTKDPTNSSNIVLENKTTPYSNRIDYCGEFTFKDNGLILANSDFAIEARFYVKNAYPLKGKESGEPLSLIAVNNNGTNIPLLRLTKDGYFQLRNSAGTYKDIYEFGVAPLNKWIKIKTVVDNDTDTVHLYIDDVYVYSLTMAALSDVRNIRILQDHGRWNILLDDLAAYTLEPIDEILDFDSFASGDTLTTTNLSATLSSSNVSYVSGNLVAKADPENADNIVSYNSGNAYGMNITTPSLYKRDFVVSGNFRFESFPSVSGGAGNVSFFAWVVGSSYKIFCGVDQNGNLLSRSEDKAYAETGIVLNKNQWYNVSVHYNGGNGKFDVYLDGDFACSGKWAPPTSAPSSQNIRVLNNYNNNNFKAYVDDIQVYELAYNTDSVRVPKDGVIYNIDFESGFAGTKPTTKEIELLSPYGSYDVHSSWTSKGTLVESDGNTSLKISGGTDGQQFDLSIGNTGYDPLKNGTVSLSYDITVEKYPESNSLIRLARWRKSHLTGVQDSVNILNLMNTGEVYWFNTPTGFVLSKGVKYNVELIFNNQILKNKQYVDVTASISYEVEENGVKKTVKETLVDSYTAVNISANGTNMTIVDNENIAYFLDDAGNKCFMPYTGLVKCFKLDAEGNQITDADGNPVFVNKLVINKTTANPDMIRMFQGSNASSADFTYYIDNLVVKQIEDKSIIDTSFEGWELFNYVKEGDKVTMPSGNSNNYLFETATNNSRFNRDSAKLVTVDGNTYAQLGGTDISGQKHFYIYDHDLNFYGKDIILEMKVYLSDVSDTAYSKPGSMIATVSKKSGSSSYDAFGFLLRADHNGYLYTDADQVNPIGQLKVGDWTKIAIVLTGNGTNWNNMRILIDDELAVSTPKSFSTMVGSRIRFTNMAYTTIGYDDISIKPYIEEFVPGPLTLGFESDSEKLEMLDTLSGDWNYGTIGATRTDADGNTVKTTEIREEGDSKYLRVNHSRVSAENLNAYLDAKESKFISEDTYLIETAIRYTANTSYALTVAEVYNAEKAMGAPLLFVKGETNEFYVTLRGVPYSITDISGNIIYVGGIDGEGFTKVAILVDDVNNTYTLYVNDRLAYYVYGEELLPCLDMPMHFMETTVEFYEDFVRLLEIPSMKFADSILDIDYVNVISTPNGLATEIKGSQTKSVLADAEFAVRFVSGLDTLYAECVGYEITVEYTEGSTSYNKTSDVSSRTVFEKIEAAGSYVTAESQNSKYLAVMEIHDIPMEIPVTITAKPYVVRNGAKVYGEAYTARFLDGAIVK